MDLYSLTNVVLFPDCLPIYKLDLEDFYKSSLTKKLGFSNTASKVKTYLNYFNESNRHTLKFLVLKETR